MSKPKIVKGKTLGEVIKKSQKINSKKVSARVKELSRDLGFKVMQSPTLPDTNYKDFSLQKLKGALKKHLVKMNGLPERLPINDVKTYQSLMQELYIRGYYVNFIISIKSITKIKTGDSND